MAQERSTSRCQTPQILAQAVLRILSPLQKIELSERESRELLAFNPEYARVYLKRKFKKGPDARQEGPAPSTGH